mmetsp:Transcript_11121/g.20812  ORF Transcript_11121/g.20812 Transcript_11121/m.20812 type:complete len:467 (-) Transcript_11121:2018-3418(-)
MYPIVICTAVLQKLGRRTAESRKKESRKSHFIYFRPSLETQGCFETKKQTLEYIQRYFTMFWGGLKPIKRRFILDCVTLGLLAHSSLIPFSNNIHATILVVACLLTITTAGWTNRWTISLPMVPIVFLQTLRYFIITEEAGDHTNSWLAFSIKAFSLLFIAKSLLLTILFPALKIPTIKGKYNVGIVDLHLPVDNFSQDYVLVRFLYPTLDKSTRIPYLDADIGAKICKTLIEVGAPPPLNKLGFLLNHWRLSTVKAKRNGTPFVPLHHNSSSTHQSNVENNSQNDESSCFKSLLPIVVYSHGLTGSAELYSYQTMNLAANGTFVMSITHSDASAIALKRKDGSCLGYDPHIANLAKEKETLLDSVRSRRRQVEYRAKEVLAAIDALLQLNIGNIQELDDLGVSFVSKLNVKDITMMGHSFGGATALTVANMRPDLFLCCVAHDPAIDWCTDGKMFLGGCVWFHLL